MPARKTSEQHSSGSAEEKKQKSEGVPEAPSFQCPTWTEAEHNGLAGFLNDVAEHAVFSMKIPDMARLIRGYQSSVETQKKINKYIFDLEQSRAIAPPKDR